MHACMQSFISSCKPACCHPFHHGSCIELWIHADIIHSLIRQQFTYFSCISLFIFFGGWGGVVSLFVLDFGDFSFISKHYRNLNTNFLKLKTMIFIDNSTVSQISSTPAHTVEFFFKNKNHALTWTYIELSVQSFQLMTT